MLSLPLGVKEVHPIELAGAYAAMANDGIYNRPYYIERIEDREGNVLYEHQADSRRALSTQSARMLTEVLEANVQGGTGRRAQLENGHVSGGKTGTTQSSEDAWFLGFSDYYTTAVWLGDPDQKTKIDLQARLEFLRRWPASSFLGCSQQRDSQRFGATQI